MSYKITLAQQEKIRRITLECNRQSERLGRPLYPEALQDLNEKMRIIFKEEERNQPVISKRFITNIN